MENLKFSILKLQKIKFLNKKMRNLNFLFLKL